MFKFQLAEKLKMTVAEIDRKVSGKELREWISYYQLKDEDYKKHLKDKALHENLETMTDTERAAQQKSVFDQMDKMFKPKRKK